MRTWSENAPKARLMEQKRRVLLDAALAAFLNEGYAGSSVNRIAAAAGVSIKTLYRHFDSKEDLFVAVVHDACDTPSETAAQWTEMPPREGLALCGTEHLEQVLSASQMDLYRVLASESHRFPELGARYQRDVLGQRYEAVARYIESWRNRPPYTVHDTSRAARTFASLLYSGIFENVLMGAPPPPRSTLLAHADDTAVAFLALLAQGHL